MKIPHVMLKASFDVIARGTSAPSRPQIRSTVDNMIRHGPPLASVESFMAPAMAVSIDRQDLEPSDVRDIYRHDESVVAVAPVMRMKLVEPVGRPQDPAPPESQVSWGVKAVGAERDDGYSGDGIVVAVLDTGIDRAHPAFSGVKLVEQNFTDDSPDDQHGHGTHCAGTIFGRDVEGKRIGIARGVEKALIGKVIGIKGGGSDKIAEAIQWAVKNGANVISMSLGIDFPGFVKEMEKAGMATEAATSTALEGYRANVALFEHLATFLTAFGSFGGTALLVAAAGNESRRPEYEVAASPPAVAEGFVCVGAASQAKDGYGIAAFSNTGCAVCGPGVDILSAKRGGGLTLMSGTSMATPHVAGVAALWAEKLSVEGSLKAKALSAKVMANATTVGFTKGLTYEQIGQGLVQAPRRP
jgi:subtilisin family serine protease